MEFGQDHGNAKVGQNCHPIVVNQNVGLVQGSASRQQSTDFILTDVKSPWITEQEWTTSNRTIYQSPKIPEINHAHDTVVPRQYPEAVICSQHQLTVLVKQQKPTMPSRASTFRELSRYLIKLPFSIHGLTIDGRGPKSVTIPRSGRTFLCLSLDHIKISR
jgi:hypothetical protein